MPRKTGPATEPGIPIVFRVPAKLHKALLLAMGNLGLDLSNLLRMLIAEHIAEYIDRGKRAAASLDAATRIEQRERKQNGSRTGSQGSGPGDRPLDLS